MWSRPSSPVCDAASAAGTFRTAIVTLPPSGKNQRASVSQWIGLVEVTITYNSPQVTAPDGTVLWTAIATNLVTNGIFQVLFYK